MGESNTKIIGSVIVGFAIVFGAYTLGNFGEAPRIQIMGGSGEAAAVTGVIGIERNAIAVVDSDNDGIEDWRNEFLTTPSVQINSATTTPYTPPDTYTGQFGLQFYESILSSRISGPFGASPETIIENSLNSIEVVSKDIIYDTQDIIIVPTTNTAIYTYANAVMQIIIDTNLPNIADEVTLLSNYLKNQEDSNAKADLDKKATMYMAMRDMTLNLGVPNSLVKEHLDLINSYHALSRDIEAMAQIYEDPVVPLLRIKRYEDDAAGLLLSLQNLFLALEPNANLFTIDDPAALLVNFSPNLQ